MKADPVPVGSLIVDSLSFSEGGTLEQALALRAEGVRGFVGYLGAMTPQRVAWVMQAGMGYMPVTFAARYSGADAVKQCIALGLPKGTTAWLDLEGQRAFSTPPAALMTTVNEWAEALLDAGYMPGLYVGSPQPFTSDELWRLSVQRYWLGQGVPRDRHGELATPKCGWCLTQVWPSTTIAGMLVDVDVAAHDSHNRAPVWAVAGCDPDADTLPEMPSAA